MSKKILIHSLIFSPDGVSTAYLYNDITLRFYKSSSELVVLTTTLQCGRRAIETTTDAQPLGGLFKESDFEGIRVYTYLKRNLKTRYFVC